MANRIANVLFGLAALLAAVLILSFLAYPPPLLR